MAGNHSDTEPRRRRAKRGSGVLLRESILDAADDLLVRTRDENAVSIRSVAQHVGVTPPSIYLHFADKTALINAVCVRHLERLGSELTKAVADQSDSFNAVRAQGLAYVRWAVDNAEIYRIALMGTTPDHVIDEVLNSRLYGPLSASIQTLISDGGHRQEDDPSDLAHALWATVHGVASMLITRPYFPWGTINEFADRVVTHVCMGLLVGTAPPVQVTNTRSRSTR